MKYDIKISTQFKKDIKLAKKRGYNLDLLIDIVDMLANGEQLPANNHDHALYGKYKGYRECHILPDWLLIYKINNNMLILSLSRTGTHSDLLNM